MTKFGPFIESAASPMLPASNPRGKTARASAHALALGVGVGVGVLGCGPSPAWEEPRHARVGCPEACTSADEVAAGEGDAADTLVDAEPAGEPASDDASRTRGPAGGVTYVTMTDWESPASVRAFETSHPPRGSRPLTVTRFPSLQLHQAIPSTGRYR